MEISVDGTVIYTGGIIGANGDPGITPPETLTNLDFESDNFVGGDTILVDNVNVNEASCMMDGCPSGFAIGDVNMDNKIDLLDVASFVDAITSPEFVCEADIDENDVVDLLDVAPFVDLLTGG